MASKRPAAGDGKERVRAVQKLRQVVAERSRQREAPTGDAPKKGKPAGSGNGIVEKKLKRNEDWVKRDGGSVPTKGAMAAERASAGLGTSDDDSGLFSASPPLNI
ncbi:MAG TPA: hypothetical protein VFB51_10510 [Solirubrobacterales bacterium]|nr:hypothetical protein [Solirubrobacterales bacterium]